MSNVFPIGSFASLKTPFYHYDLPLLSQTLSAIHTAIAPHQNYQVHYAIKANANPVILQTIARSGLGADCVSGGEIEAALYAGFPAEKIVFAGVGKADWEIELALRAGIACFNVESLPELEVINACALAMGRVANVAFRVNPNVDAHTHAKITTGLNENKFGIAMEDLLPAIRRAAEMQGVRYVGMHFHIGSQILELDVFDRLSERINQLQDELEAAGIHTSSINVGGGLGIDYAHPDAHPIPAFADYFGRFAHHLRLRAGQQLHFELGRSVVAQCGTLISRALYVKHGHTKDFPIIDAGYTELIGPAMYGSSHAIQNLTAAPGGPTAVYDVVGPICESSDVFGKDVTLAEAHRGDLIALRSAGAYGEVMASTYNCRRLPQSHFTFADK